MGRRGKRLLALLFLCNVLQLLIGEVWAGDKIEPLSFPKGERGGPPQPIVQRRSSAFDPLISKQNSPTGQPVVPQSQRRSIDLSKPSGQPNWLQQSGNGQPSWAQHSGHVSPNSNSWSFYTIGSSRNKRKLPSGKETVSEFSCRHRPPGYYADINLGCEVYHLCNRHGGGMAFECPAGTRFQQRTMVCDHKHLVECQNSEKYFHSNLRIGQANLNFIDDNHRKSSTNNDVFMQVIVKDEPPQSSSAVQTKDHHMQLVLKNKSHSKQKQQKTRENSNSFSSNNQPEQKTRENSNNNNIQGLKFGRGKDSFFLLAQDTDSPEVIRDSRRVLPSKILKQANEISAGKFKKGQFPSFPNYPVRIKDVKGPFSFHQAYGTDFGQVKSLKTTPSPSRRRPTTTARGTTTTTRSKTTTTTTKTPLIVVAPPKVDAPVSKFYANNNRRKFSSNFKLPQNHPLRQVLPPTARVVGIQPLRKIPLSNRNQMPEIMTLKDFLRKYPNMEKMRKTAIVPVPITDAKHIEMIEKLAKKELNVHQNNNHQKSKLHHQHHDIDAMFKELEQLISKRAERKISFKHHSNNNKKHKKSTSKKKNKPKSSSTVVPKVKTINEKQPKKTKKKSFANASFTSTTTSSSSKNHHHETESEHDHLSHPGLSVKPRGGSPGPRFMTTFKPSTGTAPSQFVFSSKTTQQSPLNLTPQLEFGFKPIISSTSTSKPAAAVPFTFSSGTNTRTENAGKFKSSSSSAFSAPGASSRFKFSSFDHIIDETDTLVAPRLPRQPGFSISQTHNNKFQFQSNEINIDHHDAFFFTTTPKPTTTLGGAQTGNSHSSGGGGSGSGSSSLNEIHKIKPGIFDMRKFFFIPQKTKKLHVNNNNLGGPPGGHQLQGPGQAERRVHHLHQHHFHHVPHRGFHFRGRRSSLAEIMRR